MKAYGTEAINAMSGMENWDSATVEPGISSVINTAIGLIQVAGTGIAFIMITILGIKYILASPNEKADVKKQIMPLFIGCVILFASTNLVALIAKEVTRLF